MREDATCHLADCDRPAAGWFLLDPPMRLADGTSGPVQLCELHAEGETVDPPAAN